MDELPPPSAPPGWYPDPTRPDLLRYWDGLTWTGDFKLASGPLEAEEPGPPVAAVPASADPGLPEPGPVRRRSRRTLWISACAVIAAGAVVGGVIVGISNRSSARDAAVTTSALDDGIPAADESEEAAAATSRALHAKRVSDRSNYRSVSTREWQLIEKNPDRHVGELYVVYGRVTQADGGTGSSTVRIDTDGEQVGQYDYDINTMVTEGSAGVLDQTVKDDLVTLYVEVDGSTTYETTIGGSVTALAVTAYFVERDGSAS